MEDQEKTGEGIAYEQVVKLDFEALDEWRDEASDGLPVCGITSFYRACGINDVMKKYLDEHGTEKKYAPVEILFCNFYTHRRIKNFIEERWQIFSLKPDENGKIGWDTRKYAKGKRHYKKTLSKSVAKSVGLDFLAYCPTIDDDLDDDMIVFRIPAEQPVEGGVIEVEAKDVEAETKDAPAQA